MKPLSIALMTVVFLFGCEQRRPIDKKTLMDVYKKGFIDGYSEAQKIANKRYTTFVGDSIFNIIDWHLSDTTYSYDSMQFAKNYWP